ncbi:hypothetical protein LPTSP4_00540 [Leptospira ryugenii]|uniref:Uncharacterized protein n=1 Tax=Leptospira ryugenii TaxID=1917863 RepID=A0A2P2DVB9_9LEPT|nr:hypothetical protein [Leptospira ryugenii]GBF48555.1 hypothetical protein LPTSP4_00540 [Leptospira ryugenii]
MNQVSNEILTSLDTRLRSLGIKNPLEIADIIREVLQSCDRFDLGTVHHRFEGYLKERYERELNLERNQFGDLEFEGPFLESWKTEPNFHQVAHRLKNQFSSDGKGFGKMVPRPIDFSGFAKLSEDKLDKKTILLTILFWCVTYILIGFLLLRP